MSELIQASILRDKNGVAVQMTGPKGDKGDPGPQGPQGEKGEPGDKGKDGATPAQVIAALSTETWTFTLADGSTVDKVVPLV